MNVLRRLSMLPISKRKPSKPSAVLRSSTWQRAPQSGILRAQAKLGAMVRKGRNPRRGRRPHGESEMVGGTFRRCGRQAAPTCRWCSRARALFHVGRTRQTTLLEQHLDALHDGTAITPPGWSKNRRSFDASRRPNEKAPLKGAPATRHGVCRRPEPRVPVNSG